jgi:hypothetical protein
MIQRLAHRRDWAQAEQARLDGSHCVSDQARAWNQAVGFCKAALRHDHGGRAGVQGALPAVIVPSERNAGRSLDRISTVVSGRGVSHGAGSPRSAGAASSATGRRKATPSTANFEEVLGERPRERDHLALDDPPRARRGGSPGTRGAWAVDRPDARHAARPRLASGEGIEEEAGARRSKCDPACKC